MSRHARSTDKIMESSLFLMASTALTAGLGFLFWILVDRSYSPQRVGLATSLINAISLIAYLSLFGLNSLLIRFQAPGPARNSQVSRGLLVSCCGGLLFAGGFLALLPWLSPRLLFIRDNPWYALLFVLFCGFAAVNLLTDSVFMAARMPQYNMLVDGIVQSLSKLAMPIFLVTLGAVGIVASTGIGYAVAVIASLIAMVRRLGFRFDLRTPGTLLRRHARYSAANYCSSLLNLVPPLALPMIALQKLGSEAEAYYFMAFQVANTLYAASHAIGDATFSEASHDISQLSHCLRRSARLNLIVLVPAIALVALGARLLLQLFGQPYADHAQGQLVLLSAGALAVALNNWGSSALRVVGRMRPFVTSNVAYALVSVSLAELLASRGSLWICWAWVAGNLLSGLIAALFVPRAAADIVAQPAMDTGETESAAPKAAPVDAEPSIGNEAVAGLLDETVPLVLPWLVRDPRRGGRRAQFDRPPGLDREPAAGLLVLDGDMAVRERVPAPRRNERDEENDYSW